MSLPEPRPTPMTQPYWEHAARGVLALQRCRACALVFHYPRAYCPQCTSAELEWFAATGRASLYSYVIVHRGEGAFAERGPYAVAVVELAEGPRLTTNIVGVAQTPEALVLDMALRVCFETRGEFRLPVFTPVGEGDE